MVVISLLNYIDITFLLLHETTGTTARRVASIMQWGGGAVTGVGGGNLSTRKFCIFFAKLT